MTDTEPVGITRDRIGQIPDARSLPFEPFAPDGIPSASSILESVNHDEIPKAKANKDYNGKTDEELGIGIPQLVDDCLSEMMLYEKISRQSAKERLEKLREVAPSVTRIVDFSAPGDYYHLTKEDRFKKEPAMIGADRVRSDQAAILAIVLAGIKENWPEEELLLFLNQHVLTSDNPELNKLREKAKQAVTKSGIRLVYSGREDEVKAIETVLNQKNIFIPKECVDFLGPEGIENTVGQIRETKKYLGKYLKDGDSYIVPINVQGIRGMRMAEEYQMTPPGTKALVYAMPTSTGESAFNYRSGEVKGTVFYYLTKKASLNPADRRII